MIEILRVKNEKNEIEALSRMASAIVKEHYDSIIGSAQNDYMIRKFQTAEAIRAQMEAGQCYYRLTNREEWIGFFDIYPRDGRMYLSKFYLKKSYRGRGYARKMLDFIAEETVKAGLSAVLLNVNRHNLNAISAYKHLGFRVIYDEKIDIGGGFFMDDHVMEYSL